MATEILVNDGGAPARILPFTAGSALTGGRAVQMGADGEVDTIAGADVVSLIGVALTDSTSGNNASIITGLGDKVATLADGNLGPGSASSVACGVYIDPSGAHSGAATLQRVLWTGG